MTDQIRGVVTDLSDRIGPHRPIGDRVSRPSTDGFPGFIHGTVAVILVVTAVVSGAADPVAAQPGPTESAGLVVELAPSGDARITLVETFDLETETDRTAFDAVRENRTLQTVLRDRYADRLSAVAAAAAERSGRGMRVVDPTVAVTTADGGARGIVRLAVTWEALATREDGRLVVGPPFDDGFTLDRRLIVIAPDGYGFAEATPVPTSRDGGVAIWSAGADLSGFSVVVSPVSDDADGPSTAGTDGATTPGQPGFGLGVAALAILAAVGTLALRAGPTGRRS